MRELVSLQVFVNTAGFVSSISKFRDDDTRRLNKFTLQEQCVYQNSLSPGNCWRMLQILDILGPTCDFFCCTNALLSLDLHSYRESLRFYLNAFRINELSLLWSCITTLQRGKLGKRRDLPEVTGDVWGALEGAQHVTCHHLPPGHLQESAAAIDPLLWA